MELSIVLIIFSHAYLTNCVEFNQSYVGVFLSPYVKNAEGKNPVPELASYTLDELRTTLEVISTKFSHILTLSVDVRGAPYQENQSYYNDTSIMGRTAEIAALMNRERNETILSVIVGIFLRNDNEQRTNAEVYVALEAVKIANSIYPGTVSKIVMFNSNPTSLESDKLTPKWIPALRNMTSSLNYDIQIGFLPSCGHLLSKLNKKSKDWETWEKVTLESDFIICVHGPYYNVSKNGAKYTFNKMYPEILRSRDAIKKINPDIEVISGTYWPSGGGNKWLNRSSLKEYWIEVNKFASEYEYFTFLPAFDNPNLGRLIPTLGHLGWWRLTRNNLSRNVSGFVEKFLEPEPPQKPRPITPVESENTPKWIYGGVAGLIIIITICVAIVWLIHKKRRPLLRALLSAQDLQDFLNGASPELGNRISNNYLICSSSPLSQPYDLALEIPKDNLKIFKSKILGVGQFGCVYKAEFANTNGISEVALKTTKRDCPSTALKGLLSEIKILTYLGKHPHIVSICGAYTAELDRGVVYVATEFCAMGSLKSHLMTLRNPERKQNYQNSGDDASLQRSMYHWSYEIACGMEYLGEKGVIHADLAARNVLLTSDSVAKITDFGLSRRLYDYEKYVKETREALPWRWMAIESLKCMEFSTKSDVWSYGVTLWEIFSLGDIPFPILSWNEDFIESLENGFRMNQPTHATSEMFQLMKDCWKIKPEDRPSFTDMKMIIKKHSDKANYHDLDDDL